MSMQHTPSFIWDPSTFSYRPSDAGTTDFSSFWGDQFLPDVPAARAWSGAVGAAMPGYTDQPYLRSAVERLYSPMRGQYITSETGPGQDPPDSAWGQYVGERFRNPAAYPNWLGGRTADRGVPAVGSSLYPSNWQQMLGAFRGAAPLTLADTLEKGQLAHDYWRGLADAEQAAVASYATYDPRFTGVARDMRQRGLDRLQERFFTTGLETSTADPTGTGNLRVGGPAATAMDWMNYITGQSGIVRSGLEYAAP